MPEQSDTTMVGFDAGEREIPAPEIRILDPTRDRLARQLYAMVLGHTPEEVTGHLADGFPDEVDEGLARPGERAEVDAHIDLLLITLQSPAEG